MGNSRSEQPEHEQALDRRARAQRKHVRRLSKAELTE